MRGRRLTCLPLFVLALLPFLLRPSTSAAETKPTFQIAQVEAGASYDIGFTRGTTKDPVTDPFWERSFDVNGSLLPADPDDPIAASIEPDGSFEYAYEIGYWPISTMPAWSPTVECHWKVKRDRKGRKKGAPKPSEMEGLVTQIGWTGDFDVLLPDEVGRYKLEVALRISHDEILLRREKRKHCLFVVWSPPVGAGDPPKEAWLDVASTWAQGADSVATVLDALNTTIYENPFDWSYGTGDVWGGSDTLVEGVANTGICGDFRQVWQFLAAVHGIPTNNLFYRPYENLFLTTTRPALDRNESANAMNLATGKYDRWKFGSHEVGTYDHGTETMFYDPTFGLTGIIADPLDPSPSLEGNVFAISYKAGNPGPVYRTTVFDPPPTQILVWNLGISNGTWSLCAYAAGPQPILEVRQTLLDFLPGGERKANRRIEKCIRAIEECTDLALWMDAWVLGDRGKKVFDAWAKVAKDLLKLEEALHAQARELSMIAETVAETAINDAKHHCMGAPACQEWIDEAQERIARGFEHHAAGRYDKAIKEYGKAWTSARKAMD